MTGDEARAKLDEWLRTTHGLCEHEVVMTKPKGCWVRRVPCDWPDCRDPIHEHPFARMKMRHTCFWAEGGDVWLALVQELIRDCAAAAAEREKAAQA
jgi:hypothetical protein